MLEDQIIPVSLDGGIDSKTNPKVIVAGKFLFVENAVYTNPGEIEKRNGYTALPTAIMGGGNLVAPKTVKVFNNELVCQDQGSLYGYSPTLQAWVNKGPYTSVEITEAFLYKLYTVSGHVDCAVLGNYALFVWSTSNQANTVEPATTRRGGISTICSLVDLQTGNTVLGGSAGLVSTMNTPGSSVLTSSPRAVVVGGSKLAVAYVSFGYNLVLRFLNISGASAALDATEHTIQAMSSGTCPAVTSYDIVGTPSGAIIAYQYLTTTYSKSIDTSGSIVNTWSTAMTTTSDYYPVAIGYDSGSGNAWVYWGDDTTNTAGTAFVSFAVLNSSLTLLNGPFNISSSRLAVTSLSALPVSSTSQTIYVGGLYKDSASGASQQTIDKTEVFNVTTAGLSSSGTTIYGVYPCSRTFSVGSKSYAVFVYRGPSINTFSSSLSGPTVYSQPTFFVIDLASGAVVSRLAGGIANSQATTFPNGSGTNSAGGYISSVAAISATKFLFGCGIEYLNLLKDTPVSGLVGAAQVSFDFASPRAYRAITSQQSLVLNGGLVSAYDGQTCSEMGFHLAPEIVYAKTTTTGGQIAADKYTYIVVFQWTDAQGNFHQSETSLPGTVDISASATGTNTITLYFTAPLLSQKKNVNMAVFRNAGSGSTTYTMITDPIVVFFAPTAVPIFAVTDYVSNASISGLQQIYTTGNVVDNSPPPASMIMETRQTRLYMVDSENPNTIWYSKSFGPGVGLSMSALFLIQMDPKLGNISGLSEMDEKMIVAKDQGFYWFAGDGANDTGTGVTLSTPQLLPTDQGCNSLKSLIMTPNGLFFKGPKGIYLLDRALQAHYVGAEVEKWNSQSITAATMVADKSQIRFLTDSGNTLVYDYIFSKWAYFTNHQGYAADNFQGLYTYATTSGVIFQENTTSFLDNATAFALRARLGWLALAGVQGFQRVRRLGMLGDYANGANAGHGIRVSAAYDYVESFLAAVQYLFGGSSSSGTFQYRERLIQQKCDSLSLLIEEVTTGASGESVSLTNLSLEAGVKRGLNKLPASRSVS